MTQSALFVDLSTSPGARSAIIKLADSAGVRLNALPRPRDLSELAQQLASENPAFVYTEPSSDWLNQELGIRSACFPPTLGFFPTRPDGEVLHRLRTQGLSAVVSADLGAEDVDTLRAVSGSSSWLRVSLPQMHLAQLIQSVNASRAHLVTVGSAGAPLVSGADWYEIPLERSFGRIYIADNQILHAETYNATGQGALTEMLKVAEGTVIVHTMFLPPGVEGGQSIQGALISAAVSEDHERRKVADGARAERAPSVSSNPPTVRKPARSLGALAPPRPTRPPVPPPPAERHSLSLAGLSGRSVDRPPEPAPVPSEEPAAAVEAVAIEERSPNVSEVSPGDRIAQALVISDPKTEAAVFCHPEGWVEGLSGELDGETHAAAGSMGLPHMRDIGDMLGLGALMGYCVSDSQTSVSVVDGSSRVAVTRGRFSAGALSSLEQLYSTLTRELREL